MAVVSPFRAVRYDAARVGGSKSYIPSDGVNPARWEMRSTPVQRAQVSRIAVKAGNSLIVGPTAPDIQ